MGIRNAYFDLLRHLGSTVTIRELHEQRERPDVIGLRHDIDHDLDLALETAHHEHRMGIRATYYLLHTNAYWDHEELLPRCRQLQAYGHEVGLHLNVLKEWVEGDVDDLDARLAELLGKLRDGGVDVVGTSAHGDRACYEHGFVNYWLWRELRGDDPAVSERGLSAEGIPVDDAEWQVPYPASDDVGRGDGRRQPFWTCSLAGHGLTHDAVHVPVDRYWTDTGGGWNRSPDPITHDLSKGRHQVLVHPHWWRGPQRIHFVVSTARSGSKWLASFVEKATSARGLHEWTLNHVRRDGGPGPEMVSDKRTNSDYVGLVDDRDLGASLVKEALLDMRRRRTDVVEANVYLEPYIADLARGGESVSIVHLHRDGREVVRSLLNRGWYDTPADRKHRAVPVEGWDDMTQLERCCWYYRFTHESIMPFAERSLRLDELVDDERRLHAELESMGLVIHPQLASEAETGPVNESREWSVPPFDEWPDEARATFVRICGPVHEILGYPVPELPPGVADAADPAAAPSGEAKVVFEWSAGSKPPPLATKNVRAKAGPEGLSIRVLLGANVFSHVVLAKGRWHRVKKRDGVACDHWSYYVCRFEAEVREGQRARVFAIFYDRKGNRLSHDHVATLHEEPSVTTAAFASVPGATHFALGVAVNECPVGEGVTLRSVRVQSVPIGPRYRAALAAPDPTLAIGHGVA